MEGQRDQLGGCSHIPVREDNSLSPGSEVRDDERGMMHSQQVDQAGPGDYVE